MKRYITLVCFFVLLLSGMQISFGQENPQTSEEAMKQTIRENESAKDQTFALHKIVNLNTDQIPKVNEMFLELDKSYKKLSAEMKDSGSTKLQDESEMMKRAKLKNILTTEQYETYLKFFKKE
ncbi:MAG: hypothetical protein ACSHXF_00180 [Aquaticitalea sp.]